MIDKNDGPTPQSDATGDRDEGLAESSSRRTAEPVDDLVVAIGNVTIGLASSHDASASEAGAPVTGERSGNDPSDGISEPPVTTDEPSLASSTSRRAESSDHYARRVVAFGLLAIVMLVGLAVGGTLYLAGNPNTPVATRPTVAPTATTSAAVLSPEPSTVVPTAIIESPEATVTVNGPDLSTLNPESTPTPAGNTELDGTIVDAIRVFATSQTPPDFSGTAPILAIVDGLPEGATSALIQRFVPDDEFTYIIRYFLMPDAAAARDLARLEAGIPTQYQGAKTVDDRDIPGGACVTVTVLEEMISHCYVLRGRVAVIVEILGPAAAKDHIIEAGVALAGYGRDIVFGAISD